jgi:LEA14-like dessication related protein
VVSVDFSGLSFDVVFNVVNPNVIGMDLASLNYRLTVDNHQFVAGGANRPLHVPAQGAGELHLPVTFKFVELAEALVSLFQKALVPYGIAVQLGFGTPIGVITVPISHNGMFPVPRIPDISIGRATVGRISATGADLDVGLTLHNGNKFAVPVTNLNYRLTLEGAPLAQAGTGYRQLAPGATQEVPLSVRADFLQAGLGILRAIESRSATIALEGTLELAGFSVPVRVSRTLQ